MAEDHFTIEEVNEHIKSYIIDFIDEFVSPENTKKEVTLRKTTIEVGNDVKRRTKLPIEITTTAHKTEDGLIRDASFRIITTKGKVT